VGGHSILELQNDFELKPKFKKSHQEFWLQKEIPDRYPAVWREIKKLLISYLVERGFSVVERLEITQRGDLRLSLTEIKPDIAKTDISSSSPSITLRFF
jgi:hypothetical protein